MKGNRNDKKKFSQISGITTKSRRFGIYLWTTKEKYNTKTIGRKQNIKVRLLKTIFF